MTTINITALEASVEALIQQQLAAYEVLSMGPENRRYPVKSAAERRKLAA